MHRCMDVREKHWETQSVCMYVYMYVCANVGQLVNEWQRICLRTFRDISGVICGGRACGRTQHRLSYSTHHHVSWHQGWEILQFFFEIMLQIFFLYKGHIVIYFSAVNLQLNSKRDIWVVRRNQASGMNKQVVEPWYSLTDQWNLGPICGSELVQADWKIKHTLLWNPILKPFKLTRI